MVEQVLQRFGFTYSSPQSTPLPTGHSLSAPPSNESVEPSGPYLELVGCLMYLMTCTRPDLAYPLSLLARYVAPVRRAWDLCLEDGLELSSLVTQTLHGCEAEITELRWLTYLLTDLGEAPCSPPVLYVHNKAMLALCHEHRLEHRTKHIALRYFLARKLQQRGQLRLAYVASQANTADVFTKAPQPCDHQRFCTVLGLVDAIEPVEVAVDSGSAPGTEPAGAGSGGAETGGSEPGGAESGGAEPGGAETGGAEPGGAETGGAEPGGTEPGGAEPGGRATGAGGTTAAAGSGGSGSPGAGPGGTSEAAGVGPTRGSAGASAGPGAAGSAGTGAAGATGVGAAGGVGVGGSADAGASEGAGTGGATDAGALAGSPGAVPAGSGGATRPRPYFVPLLEQGLGLPPSPGPAPPLECPQPIQVLYSFANPASNSLRAASPTVARFLATVVTDPSLASTAASALVAELVDFAARCRLDYAASLVAESASVCPPSVGGECAVSTDVLEDRQEEFQCFAAALPHLVSTLLAPEGDPDAPDIPTPRSYAEAIEGPYSCV
ncbi:unnamed protein product [Closterium sp. NIES-53]